MRSLTIYAVYTDFNYVVETPLKRLSHTSCIHTRDCMRERNLSLFIKDIMYLPQFWYIKSHIHWLLENDTRFEFGNVLCKKSRIVDQTVTSSGMRTANFQILWTKDLDRRGERQKRDAQLGGSGGMAPQENVV